MAPVAFIGDYEIEIPPLELDFDGDQALPVTTFKDPTFVERLRSDTLSEYWLRQRDDDQQKEGWELHKRRELIHRDSACLPERNGSQVWS